MKQDAIPIWRTPLHRRVRVAQAGVAVHGVDRRAEVYRLPELWCVHLYEYEATLRVGGARLAIRPGHASVVPAGEEMRFEYLGPSRHAYAHFRFDPESARRRDASGRAPSGARPAMARLPAMQDLGPRFGRCLSDLREAVGWATSRPDRADVRVWDLLWRLAEAGDSAGSRGSSGGKPGAASGETTGRTPGGAPGGGRHPALESAIELIESMLVGPIEAAALARRVGVSHNHLIRLFRRHTGRGIAEYIRRRRAQAAAHMLVQSTLPIKAVAASVGLTDLQHFNKLMRREWGRSPREVRRGGI